MAGDSPLAPGSFAFDEDMPGMYHVRSAGFAFADGHRKSCIGWTPERRRRSKHPAMRPLEVVTP